MSGEQDIAIIGETPRETSTRSAKRRSRSTRAMQSQTVALFALALTLHGPAGAAAQPAQAEAGAVAHQSGDAELAQGTLEPDREPRLVSGPDEL
jgi:hypothetical protein